MGMGIGYGVEVGDGWEGWEGWEGGWRDERVRKTGLQYSMHDTSRTVCELYCTARHLT
jgi:hypothetical protein